MTATVASQSGRIGVRLQPARQVLISLIFYFIAILLYWKSGSPGMLIIPSLLFGIGHGMILPCIQNLLVSYAPFNERAAFMSANSVLTRSGQTLGPLFAGLFYSLAGFNGVYISGAVLILIMAGITIALGKTEKSLIS
jgi:MFS family permease